MLRDAGEFAGHIKKCEKDIRILKNATEGLPRSLLQQSLVCNLSLCSWSISWHCRSDQYNKGSDVFTPAKGL